MGSELIAELSQQYGTGDVLTDVNLLTLALVLVSLLCSLLTVIQSAARERKVRSQLEKFPWGGKLEKLERNLNEFQTETRRALELIKNRSAASPELGKEERGKEKKEGEGGGLVNAAPESSATTITLSSTEVRPDERVEALTTRLKSSRRGIFDKIKAIFGARPSLDTGMVEDLRALLIAADLGPRLVDALVEEVKQDISSGKEVTEDAFVTMLKARVLALLEQGLPSPVVITPTRRSDGPKVVLVVGVNGVGKTTTVAKLAHQWKAQGAKVLMVAADTFRAAAVAQLSEWADRVGVPVVSGADNAKPSTVIFDAMQRVSKEEFDVVIIDTAGRLHTKANLMQELEGVRNAIQKHLASAPHETLLVLDGSTGQNALNQAREFHAAVPLTGLVVTKLDGTPKGGVVVAVQGDIGVPVRYIGVGESPQDLREFNPQEFVEALFDRSEKTEIGSDPHSLSAHGEVRRRRRSVEAVL